LFLVSSFVKAQNDTFVLDTIYSFKHPKSVATPDAFKNGYVTDFKYGVEKTKVIFDELNNKVFTYKNGILSEVSEIREISYINGEKYVYTNVLDNMGVLCGGGFVVTKGTDGKMYLAGSYISPLKPDVVNGFYSKIEKGDK
jgi:hypothetical protein